jgi:hypothetical protein
MGFQRFQYNHISFPDDPVIMKMMKKYGVPPTCLIDILFIPQTLILATSLFLPCYPSRKSAGEDFREKDDI